MNLMAMSKAMKMLEEAMHKPAPQQDYQITCKHDDCQRDKDSCPDCYEGNLYKTPQDKEG